MFSRSAVFAPNDGTYYTAPELTPDRITLVDTLKGFRACVNRVTQPGTVVGLDAEWTPSMLSGRPERLSIFQLAVRERVYVLDVKALHMHLPVAEWHSFADRLFCNDQVIKVGFHVPNDLRMLVLTFPFIKNRVHPDEMKKMADIYVRSLEVEKIAHMENFYPNNGPGNDERKDLSEIVRKTQGKPLYKGPQLSDWDIRPISPEKLRYAALDAYCLLDVYEFMERRIRELNAPVDLFKKLSDNFWKRLP